ncbi:DUF72 domain-containing protein [Methyloligella sp. 2.7D]|uniref:DUF72 domain-containing protein n=1 Tax=unclassified Methyloligella TaxID=2625955 RepID=UPI00157DBBD6|nr:DUF72 domain-containing protein [Methyloligella sp. GL2]QKP76120.1 DUF72 domain-containing protein [Methyloligella sp. GL2]
MAATGDIRIGISGWTYKPWRGVFYPDGLTQKRELEYASRQFRSIEINGTFYGLQRPESFARWREETPEGFVFSVKAPRYITHLRRLREVEAPVANFLASGLFNLKEKLGPILWQFPPNMKFEAERFEDFFKLLPHDTQAASKLAKRHDDKVTGRAVLTPDKSRPMRHAVEIRHDSFRNPAFVALLRKYRIALVCADTVDWPRLMDVTADFIYCRLHGSEELYASGYDDEALKDWARRIRAWAKGGEPKDAERVCGEADLRKTGRDVFVYFDNDRKVLAPKNAETLAKRLGIGK